MESGKGHQEGEEEKDEVNDAAASNNIIKDGKNSEKANAIRSKHSVTEQRRRSKINERFQILRKLVPHGDQKRDTASFLLEVIEYVKFLQDKVQKYEGSYQPCSSEPTKLMPWRNSHWNAQSVAGQPQNETNGSGPGSTFPSRFDAKSVAVSTATLSGQENPIESDALRGASYQSIDLTTEVPNEPMSMPMPTQMSLPVSITNDGAFTDSLLRPASEAQSTECPNAADSLNGHDELTIEGGTISISSVYSHRLLNSLTRALQSTGVDLSQASVSVEINLGKRANRGPTPCTSTAAKDLDTTMPSGNQPVRLFQDPSDTENSDQSQKRLKIVKNG